MLSSGLVETQRLWELFSQIEDQLYRFPAVDPRGLRKRLEAAIGRPDR